MLEPKFPLRWTCEQGSEIWHDKKKKSVGASSAAAIMDCCPFSTKIDVYEKMVLDKPFIQTKAMAEGIRKEPLARKWCEEQLDMFFENPTYTHAFIPYLHASYDCMSFDGSTIGEIKCPGEKTHRKIMISGEIPYHYQWQLLHQMEVWNIDKAFFCSYMNDDDAIIIWMARDDVRIVQLKLAIKDFYNCYIVPKIPPSPKEGLSEDVELLDKDTRDFYDMNFRNIEEMEAKIKYWKDLVDFLKKEMIERSQGKSIKLGKYKMTKYVVKGSIDYSEIPELKGINLEAFRGEPRTQWRFNT